MKIQFSKRVDYLVTKKNVENKNSKKFSNFDILTMLEKISVI